MTVSTLFVCGLIGFLVSWGLIPVILEACRRTGGAQRDKCFHQTNKETIPRLGGIALGAAFLGGMALRFFFKGGSLFVAAATATLLGSLGSLAAGLEGPLWTIAGLTAGGLLPIRPRAQRGSV